MALQARVPGDSDYRRCNPERDMIWALPRFFGNAIRDLGTAKSRRAFCARLKMTLREHGIHIGIGAAHHALRLFKDNDDFMNAFEEFVKKVGSVFPALRDDPKGAGIQQLQEIFSEPRFSSFRQLLSLLVMRRLMSEVTYWIQQVKASSKEPPRPQLERIEEATRDVLNQLM